MDANGTSLKITLRQGPYKIVNSNLEQLRVNVEHLSIKNLRSFMGFFNGDSVLRVTIAHFMQEVSNRAVT